MLAMNKMPVNSGRTFFTLREVNIPVEALREDEVVGWDLTL